MSLLPSITTLPKRIDHYAAKVRSKTQHNTPTAHPRLISTSITDFPKNQAPKNIHVPDPLTDEPITYRVSAPLDNFTNTYRRKSTVSFATDDHDILSTATPLPVISDMLSTYNDMIAANTKAIRENQEVNYANTEMLKEGVDSLLHIVLSVDTRLKHLEGVGSSEKNGKDGNEPNPLPQSIGESKAIVVTLVDSVGKLVNNINSVDERVSIIERVH
jgi:hypothetical protein|eukprot:scaffold1593_cov193-Alexandrium_tamarense.AAC.33